MERRRASSESAGLDPHVWQPVFATIDQWIREDRLPALSVHFGTQLAAAGPFHFGRARLDDLSAQVDDETLFLVASITKPIVAMATLKLVEQGQLLLGTKACEIVPEFGRQGTYGIIIRHLLTHSSGLPDMLPNNLELRQQQAPLLAFLEGINSVELEFPTGRNATYSSMGFALLGEIIARVAGVSLPEYLQREFFGPLGMHDTVLGTPDDWYTAPQPKPDRIAEIRVPEEMRGGTDWNWNSRYWRSLGAPWGGLITTARDLGRYAQMMLGGGHDGMPQILSPISRQIATENQLESMRDIPEPIRRCKSWGLGWRRHWPNHSANFGDLVGPNSYGHWGATGTLLWIDPANDRWCVVLTTQPQEPDGTHLAKLSNLISAAMGYNFNPRELK